MDDDAHGWIVGQACIVGVIANWLDEAPSVGNRKGLWQGKEPPK
jgi:hypothetical protein